MALKGRYREFVLHFRMFWCFVCQRWCALLMHMLVSVILRHQIYWWFKWFE